MENARLNARITQVEMLISGKNWKCKGALDRLATSQKIWKLSWRFYDKSFPRTNSKKKLHFQILKPSMKGPPEGSFSVKL